MHTIALFTNHQNGAVRQKMAQALSSVGNVTVYLAANHAHIPQRFKGNIVIIDSRFINHEAQDTIRTRLGKDQRLMILRHGSGGILQSFLTHFPSTSRP